MTEELESNIPKLYIFRALYGALLMTPIIVLFWKQNGLSMFEVMVLQALFAISVIVLEVPSGYIADIYGRKNTLVVASIFATVGMGVYAIGQGFMEFLVAEIIWAVGVSLVSGADTAMFYDTLVELGEEDTYKEKWGRSTSYYMITAAAAAILGGFIGEFNLRWPFYAQLPVIAAMIPVAYSLKEPRHHKDLGDEETKSLKAVVTEVAKTKDLRLLILYGAFVYASLQTAFWLYQPYFKLTGLQVASFGLIFAGFNVVSAGASKYAHAIEDRLGMALSLVSLTFLITASLALMSSFVFIFAFGFVFLQQFVRGFSKPVISDYVNKLVDSENRSTILSTQSLVGRLLQAALMPGIGLVSDVYSVTQALSVLGVTVVTGGTVLMVLMASQKIIEI